MAIEQSELPRNFEGLPEGTTHYETLEEVPWNIKKYFQQRHKIFSKYDHGIWLTDDAWFGVTPEPVANAVARHLSDVAPEDKDIIVDAFAGVGGNAIAFARSGRWKQIHAVECDAAILACAKHNARVYGVEDRITWHHGDCFALMPRELAHLRDRLVLFASPPWGGTGYRSDTIFDLSRMQPYSLGLLLSGFQPLTHCIALYLPRSADLRQLATHARSGSKISVTHYCMDGASKVPKALCAYLGDLSDPHN